MFAGLSMIIGGICMILSGIYIKELDNKKSFLRAGRKSFIKVGIGLIVVGVLFLIT
jgi:hypothetical protein